MSREDVEVFKRAIAAYNCRDVLTCSERDRSCRRVAPVEPGDVRGGIHGLPGNDDIRGFMREVDGAFAAVQLECQEFRDLRERIVAIGRLRARGKASGAQTDHPSPGWST
jgi:hypothetical protein